ncbi:AraC-like DNA-binding protein [Litorivivens lipolytica]|uniref:AraC-like DNA-binding protein n=2 Tax=Litorivivens lipolytica TaxID=1524264 RepID=A0A7W4Z5S3_9GAMM|nr:AraC-like DNA-binding protein [Litorivivens lipolytica]
MSDRELAGERVAASFVKAVLVQARHYGCDVGELIAAAGLDENPLGVEQPQSVTVEQYSRLCVALFRSIGDESGGFLPGVNTPLGGTRMLAYSMIGCRNLEQALRRAMDFNATCRERGDGRAEHELQHDPAAKTVRLSYLSGADVQPGMQVSVLYSLAIWVRFCSWLIDQPIELLQAGCADGEPSRRRGLDHFFHCPVHFGESSNWVEFADSVLRKPIARSESDLERFLKLAPYHVVIKPMVSDGGIAARIRELLGDDFRRELPAFDELARQLNMSERTLRRRLDREGTSYQRIKDQLRREEAIAFLRNPELTVSDVAELLGFSDPSAFHRSFKRWTGRSPGDYRLS